MKINMSVFAVKFAGCLSAVLWLVIAVGLSFVVGACGSDPEFRVDGRIDGLGTQNLKVVYYSGGSVQQISAPSIDGKFSAVGRTDGPVLVEVYNNTSVLLGRFIADRGDAVEARFSVKDPSDVTLKGNDDSERLASFIRGNKKAVADGDVAALNRAVAEYVRKNPGRFVSCVLLTQYFSPRGCEAEALELLNLLEKNARPMSVTEGFEMQLARSAVQNDSIRVDNVRLYGPGDSATVFSPRGARLTLMILGTSPDRRADSTRMVLAQLRGGNPASVLRIADISVDRDTAEWKRSLRIVEDDAPDEILRYWTPAGTVAQGLEPLAVTDLPFYAVVDLAGRPVYRGESLSAAREAIGHWLKKR